MSYSITPTIQSYTDKQGLSKVYFTVIYKRMKAYDETKFKIEPKQFAGGKITKHPNAKVMNAMLNEQKNAIEKRLLDALRDKTDFSKEELTEIVKGEKQSKDVISKYVIDISEKLKGKLSEGRLKHYRSGAAKIEAFSSGATFSNITVTWLNNLEAYLRRQENRYGEELDSNTVHQNMKMIKGLLNRAREEGLIKREQFDDYKVPKYEQKMPEYLTQTEMNKLYRFLLNIDRPKHKLSGFYFLLGCYAGYRISDMQRFDYATHVVDGRVRIRTKKNGKIVAMAIHPRLRQVLDYIKDKPFEGSEQKMRDRVKELATYIGISRNIKVHTSRHSFGMLLAETGFSKDEAAELMGDTRDVVEVYFRMTDTRMDRVVMERLGGPILDEIVNNRETIAMEDEETRELKAEDMQYFEN